jgi:hypothetical protein
MCWVEASPHAKHAQVVRLCCVESLLVVKKATEFRLCTLLIPFATLSCFPRGSQQPLIDHDRFPKSL